MNIDCMIVHQEFYIYPDLQIRYQMTKGFPNDVYEVWEEKGKTKHRTVEKMTGVQVFKYPEYVRKFALTLS